MLRQSMLRQSMLCLALAFTCATHAAEPDRAIVGATLIMTGINAARIPDDVTEAGLLGMRLMMMGFPMLLMLASYLVYLRFERMRGHLDAAAWAAEVETMREALGRIDAPHWKQFLAAWPQG